MLPMRRWKSYTYLPLKMHAAVLYLALASTEHNGYKKVSSRLDFKCDSNKTTHSGLLTIHLC